MRHLHREAVFETNLRRAFISGFHATAYLDLVNLLLEVVEIKLACDGNLEPKNLEVWRLVRESEGV